MPTMHLAEHIVMIFMPSVTLLGEYIPDVRRAFRPGTLSRHDEAAMQDFGEIFNADIWILGDSRNSIQHLSEWMRPGNEITDGLAREGIHTDSTYGGCLTFSEIATRVKQGISSSWRQAPVREWYEGNRPGAALFGTSSRREETTLARLRSGHTRAQRHVAGHKVYPPCPNCSVVALRARHSEVLLQFFIV
ncbi:catalase [Trichonephila clavipes]|nr:catalase [Trichonephila clavipes]